MKREYGRTADRRLAEEADMDAVAGSNVRAMCCSGNVSDWSGPQTTGGRHCLRLIQCSSYRWTFPQSLGVRSPRLESYTKKCTFTGQFGLLTVLGHEVWDDPRDHARRAATKSGEKVKGKERKRGTTLPVHSKGWNRNAPAALERCLSPASCNKSTTLDPMSALANRSVKSL